jgi:exosortase
MAGVGLDNPEHSPRTVMETMTEAWPLLLGFVVMAIPTIQLLANQTWSHEEGAHGPLVLCTGAWLLWRRLPEIRKEARPGNPWIVAVLMAVSLGSYIFGQAFDFITLAAAGLYGVGLAIFYGQYGARAMRRNWFILLYLAFAVPPPSIWIDQLTAPLKQFVSTAATMLLQPFGIPVAHEGVVIYVAQYQLLVEDACSGLNSIIGLLAISLFYIYLLRESQWWYAIFLACLTVPIAVVANIFRITVLILLTYFAGDDVAQGFLHFAAGIVVFIIALSLVFLVDALLFRLIFVRRRQA